MSPLRRFRKGGPGPDLLMWGVWPKGAEGGPPTWVSATREEAERVARKALFAASQGHWRAWLSLRGMEPSPESWAEYAEAAEGEGGPAMEVARIEIPAESVCAMLREAGGMGEPEVWEEGWEKAGGEGRDPKYR